MSEKVKIREIDLYVINQVKMYREKKGISQEALAFHLGVSPGYRAKYTLSHLNSAAKLFGCSPRDFLPLEPL
jgi:transcriptional regulator with XRE-family HTH domain